MAPDAACCHVSSSVRRHRASTASGRPSEPPLIHYAGPISAERPDDGPRGRRSDEANMARHRAASSHFQSNRAVYACLNTHWEEHMTPVPPNVPEWTMERQRAVPPLSSAACVGWDRTAPMLNVLHPSSLRQVIESGLFQSVDQQLRLIVKNLKPWDMTNLMNQCLIGVATK